jgi:hypothetical protein
MPSLKLFVIGSSLASLVVLGGCSNGNQTSNSAPNPSPTSAPTPAQTTTAAKPTDATSSPATTQAQEKGKSNQGGQVIESGIYHLELVTVKEANGIHLDFFLQRSDNHEAIADAKVKALVELPDGTKKNLDLEYDAAGKHYAVLLPATAAGEYKVAILSDIKGERVNGRFSFTR